MHSINRWRAKIVAMFMITAKGQFDNLPSRKQNKTKRTNKNLNYIIVGDSFPR